MTEQQNRRIQPGIQVEAGATAAGARVVVLISLAVLAWFGLLLQFVLSLAVRLEADDSLAGAIVWFFSYFTILTNAAIGVTVLGLLAAPATLQARALRTPVFQTGLAVAITVVGLTYELLLRSLWNPQGLQFVADLLLHTAVPLSFIAYWLVFVPKGTLRSRDLSWWLCYPLLYFVYAMSRGLVTGEYPYPFLDTALGYDRVALNACLMLAAFTCVGLLFIGVDRWIASRSK